MGKVFKAVKKVTKKVLKVTQPLNIGHKVIKSMGLPDPVGDYLYGENRQLSPAEQAAKNAADQMAAQAKQAEAALKQQEEANKQALALANAAQLAKNNQNALANQGKDSNVAQFEFGDAGAPDDPYLETRRRKRKGKSSGNLSSQLGVV